MDTATAPEAETHLTGVRDRSINKPKRPRVQLDFSPEAYERVRQLTEMAKADSIPDMFRDALRIYEWYQVRKQEGYRMLIQKDGESTAVDLGL